MSATKVTLTDHVKAVMTASKADTNTKLLALSNAVTAELRNMDTAKADKSDIAETLEFIRMMRLYVDEDGDYAQRDTEEEE